MQAKQRAEAMSSPSPEWDCKARIALIRVNDAEGAETISLMFKIYGFEVVIERFDERTQGIRPAIIFVDVAADLHLDDRLRKFQTVWVGTKIELMANRVAAAEHAHRLTLPVDIVELEKIVVALI